MLKNRLDSLLWFARYLVPKMWYVRGHEKSTGDPLSFIWCGPDKQQDYIINRIFADDQIEIRCLGRRPLFRLDSVRRAHGCSFAVVAGPQSALSWMGRDDDIRIPWWIDAELEIEGANETTGKPKSLKDDLRKMRKNNLSFRFATTKAECQFFYEQMYLPTIQKSHGGAALPSSFSKRCAEIEAGNAELMFVTMEGHPIGGMLLDYRNEIPAIRDLGIIYGDREVLKTGVITAANVFAMEHFKKQGHQKVCLGLSRCFLDDGVLSYKRKWKPTLIETSSEAFIFRVAELSDATRSFLLDSSFITSNAGNLQFSFFAANDDDIESSKQRLEQLSSAYGIDKHSYIDLSGRRPEIKMAS